MDPSRFINSTGLNSSGVYGYHDREGTPDEEAERIC